MNARFTQNSGRKALLVLALGLITISATTGLYVSHARANVVDATSEEEKDQIAVAKAYLKAAADEDWNTLISVTSSYVWPRTIAKEGSIARYMDRAYGLSRNRSRLKQITDVKLGPVVSKPFFVSALPYITAGDFQGLEKSKTWPSKPSRAVLFNEGSTTYFLFLVHENGGWRMLGDPLSSKAEWLTKYRSYEQGMDQLLKEQEDQDAE